MMRPNAVIEAHTDPGRINEADPTALSKSAGQKTTQRRQATLQQLNKAVIAHQILKNSTAGTSTRNSGNSAQLSDKRIDGTPP
uniref:hypothetical protein n=1 Tax=Nitrosomonas communis TaxID=44574 RepID=UPI003709C591